MIRRIVWKPTVTPTEAAFLAEWLAIRQNRMPIALIPRLPDLRV